MLQHYVKFNNKDTDPFSLLYKGIYLILQELHSAYSNQLAASLHSETPSGNLGKLLAPPWHCFSTALLNS